jgi:hypothetical protein
MSGRPQIIRNLEDIIRRQDEQVRDYASRFESLQAENAKLRAEMEFQRNLHEMDHVYAEKLRAELEAKKLKWQDKIQPRWTDFYWVRAKDGALERGRQLDTSFYEIKRGLSINVAVYEWAGPIGLPEEE